MSARVLTAAEAAVIEAAQDWADTIEGAKYGPMAHHIKKAEKALLDAVADLAAENDGRWIPLGEAAERVVNRIRAQGHDGAPAMPRGSGADGGSVTDTPSPSPASPCERAKERDDG